MTKMKLAMLAIWVIGVGCLAAVAQTTPPQQPAATPGGVVPDGKLVVLDTSVFPEKILELRQKYEQVQTQFKTRSDKLQSDQTRFKQLEDDLRTKSSALPQDKVTQMQLEYEDLKKRITRDLEDARTEYAKAEDLATKPVREKLFQFIQTYATQRGITLILSLPGLAQNGTLAYFNQQNDITEDFIKEYNKANPVPVATPAAAPKPTPTKPSPNN